MDFENASAGVVFGPGARGNTGLGFIERYQTNAGAVLSGDRNRTEYAPQVSAGLAN